MIKTKEDLKRCLEREKEMYGSPDLARNIKEWMRGSLGHYLWRYVKCLRKLEYHRRNRTEKKIHYLPYYWYSIQLARLGLKLGIEAHPCVFGEGLQIHHPNGIVVNGNARVGKNCILHGANVIGNMGEGTGAPVIGDDVRLGTGAKVLGEITIADRVQIGAGALVIHSCTEEGALLVGVPARVHKRSEKGLSQEG